MIKASDILINEGFSVKIIDLSDGLDPDEFLEKKVLMN